MEPSMSTPKTPLLAVDIIIELSDQPQRSIILIERKNPPHGWSLPGGFVDVGETVEAAAVREARDEISLDVELRALLGVYSDPKRDPRGHCVSIVFVAGAKGTPRANDDAKTLRVCDADQPGVSLVFDHEKILADYRAFRDRGSVRALGS
jgi:8-oxo-dGTP diphosphatase